MPTLNELTEDQFKHLLDEYFATPEKRYKMTEQEIQEIAKLLNEKIDVPIINETQEEKILIKIVISIDTFLYNNLPNEFYDLVRSLDKGIDDEEAKRLIKRLAKLANDKIDMPYLPEAMEYIAIRFVISIIVNAARRKWDIMKAKHVMKDQQISSKSRVTDKELEQLVPVAPLSTIDRPGSQIPLN
jgi:hypothetical protein